MFGSKRKAKAKATVSAAESTTLCSETCSCGCIKCSQELKALKEKYANLKAQNEDLESEHRNLKAENERLRQHLLQKPAKKLEEDSSSKPKKRKEEKGCGCKKGCGKNCGCMKHDKICGELCKCLAKKCQNRENKNDANGLSVPNINGDIYNENSENFDPMKPRRELPRSPINFSYRERSYASNVSFPSGSERNVTFRTESCLIKPTQENKVFTEDLKNSAEDWEKHQAGLKSCPKCKRRFFKNRLAKHIPSCKNI